MSEVLRIHVYVFILITAVGLGNIQSSSLFFTELAYLAG
jgi:hypothetical protein